jgi:hypothetical protein
MHDANPQPVVSSVAFAPTQPLPAHPAPPSPQGRPRVAPPRPQMPSDMPIVEHGAPELRSGESVLNELGLAGHVETTPSSRLPAGVLHPDRDPAPAPPSTRQPNAAADATQPATRLLATGRAGVQVTTVPSPVVPDLRPGAGQPPTLVEALGASVRVGQHALALWMPLAAVAVVFAIGFASFTGLAGALSSRGNAPAPVVSSAEPVVEPRIAPEAKPAPPVERPLGGAGRAAGGDEKALSELKSRAAKERTIDEALAISAGQAELRKAQLSSLGRESKQVGFANDASNVKKLLEYVNSPDTSRQALEIIARLSSSVGPDVLYQVWTGSNKRTATTELAEALTLSKDVREKASPALAVVIDLRTGDSCEQVKQALPRAIEHGDRRAVPWLGKLTRKTGCGAGKRSDCHPCLRDGDDLKMAVKAAGKRPAPRY